MAESTQPKNWTMGTIALRTGDPTTYTVAVEQGNLQISGLMPEQKEEILVEDRGAFSTLINGKQTYPTATFTAYLRDLVDATDQTLVGIALKKGAFASALSTLGANRPYTVDLIWTMDGTSQGDAANHTVTLEDFRVTEVSFGEAEINTVTISGTCYGTISMT